MQPMAEPAGGGGRLVDLTVAVFGLGEAGSAIAADLAVAGATVRGFDPAPVPDVVGVERVDDPAQAVSGATLVLAVTAAADAREALRQALHAIEPTTLYADLSTGSASAKRELASVAEGHGAAFVDVALMSTVPGKGLQTPSLVSGSGARRYAELLAPVPVPLEVAGAEAGAAATRKLLRSVVLKGFAALLIESLEAARAAGLEGETWANLVGQFTAADGEFLERMVTGTGTHARRRLHEMEATVELLTDLGVEPLMTSATVAQLERALRDGVESPPTSRVGL